MHVLTTVPACNVWFTSALFLDAVVANTYETIVANGTKRFAKLKTAGTHGRLAQ